MSSDEEEKEQKTAVHPVLVFDVGGSHMTSALVDLETGRIERGSAHRIIVDSKGDAEEILAGWKIAAERSLKNVDRRRLVAVGFSMPGPFDYARGICLIRGLGKFESLYGMNLAREMAEILRVECPIVFRNDAHCFLQGEAWRGAAKGHDRAIGLTIGTGFGSGFYRDGCVVEQGQGVPPGGYLYCQPYRESIAEEYFSGRGLLEKFYEPKRQGKKIKSVKALAEKADYDRSIAEVFREYGETLAEFMSGWAAEFHPTCLVVGGNVSRAWHLFGGPLRRKLQERFAALEVKPAELFEDAALLGAAKMAAQAHVAGN